MPLYESRHNAENAIRVSDAARDSLVFGQDNVAKQLARAMCERGTKCRVALDGWYGVDFRAIAEAVKGALGSEVELVSANELFRDQEAIAAYKQAFITDDPGFGWVNREGRLHDLIDDQRVADMRGRMDAAKGAFLLYGCGACTEGLTFDLVIYAEKNRQPLLWQMWDGKLAPFGCDEPRPDYFWKEYYYCDYYLLNEQKKLCTPRMDFYLDANATEDVKLAPRFAYDEILETLVTYPVKEIKIFQPGPWGAYRYRDLFDVPGLECNAWNELAGPELGMLVDVGREDTLCIPFVSLLKHAERFVGAHIAENYPDLFPMDVWLDDGYFERPEPAERISMPIHNHPSTDYVRRHFNEPLGRYETYYIAEAYEGANTWMGYQDECDLEEWERKCRASENKTPIENWKDYLCNWDSNVGDLYLIPPGTAHGHGGNQMVLEMDTCPSIAGTEYSFFTYDFARNSWDDETKTMTGKPCKMHLEHSFDNDKFRRGEWVGKHLLAKPKVAKWTKTYQLDRYQTLSEMPFEIERFHFEQKAENDTEGRFAHILTLTVGSRVRVVSKADPEKFTEIERFQSCVVPACFGAYELVNLGSGFTTVVQLRWKKG